MMLGLENNKKTFRLLQTLKLQFLQEISTLDPDITCIVVKLGPLGLTNQMLSTSSSDYHPIQNSTTKSDSPISIKVRP